MSKNLLIVNDDMVEMLQLIESLGRKNIQAVIVGSVEEAIEQVKKVKFDLIITDIGLKTGLTGIDLIREIRKSDKQTKIFVATGYGDFYQKPAMEAGADLYFEKPMDLREHILKPLGISLPQAEAKKPAAVEKSFTLRMAVHELGNKNNCTVLVSSVLKEDLGEFLKNEKFPPKVREVLERAVSDLNDIEQSGKAADVLLKKLRGTIYKTVDPDKIMIDGRLY